MIVIGCTAKAKEVGFNGINLCLCVEIALGLALIVVRKQRAIVGWIVAAFFVIVFPGNIWQFIEARDAFGLDSDLARGVRLIFQPVLVIWALWCTGAWTAAREAWRARQESA